MDTKFLGLLLQLSFSPATTNATHVKVLALLASIFAVTSILGGLCLYVGHSYGWNLFLFMIAEVNQNSFYLLYP